MNAQQRQQITFKTPSEDSKYTRQLNIEVGDLPNHIIRFFEVHRIYPTNAPLINGLKLVEEWGRGAADYIDGNGNAYVYDEYVMENGDKAPRRALRNKDRSSKVVSKKIVAPKWAHSHTVPASASIVVAPTRKRDPDVKLPVSMFLRIGFSLMKTSRWPFLVSRCCS